MEVREPSAKYLARAAYKQTEVGVIPEEWKAEKLGEHATFRTGPFGSALHQSDYVDGGVPVINPMQLIDGKIVPTPSMSISEVTARRLSDFRLVENEIVIGRRGDMGRCAVVQPAHSGWLCGTGSMIIRCKGSLNASFAQRVLSSPQVIAEIENTSVGTTMINLNQGTLRDLLIPTPSSVTEQQAIAKALSDADALIEALEQFLAKKRQIKQGATQELLTGQRRLPGFAGEWEVKRLGSIAEMSSGGTPTSSNSAFYDGPIRWVAIADITKAGKYIEATERNLSEDGLANCAAKMFPIGTVLYAMYASLGECSIAKVPLSSSQAILGIQAKAALSSEFLYYFLQSIKPQVRGMGQQGTQANLNKGMVQDFQLRLPPIDEQSAIVTVLSDMDADIAALEAKLAKARQLKQGMMTELLTGRIRLV
ncbi:MAG: restriction endonuclease subunit S [Proteobacteria bacterium]|nr:restriction endonuclease subunit S [Pseudomonadota bacterium]